MKKLVSGIKFNNGARFKCYFTRKVPSLAKEANDFIFVELTPEKNRGEKSGWYMNVYDANNVIWLLSEAILKAHEEQVCHCGCHLGSWGTSSKHIDLCNEQGLHI